MSKKPHVTLNLRYDRKSKTWGGGPSRFYVTRIPTMTGSQGVSQATIDRILEAEARALAKLNPLPEPEVVQAEPYQGKTKKDGSADPPVSGNFKVEQAQDLFDPKSVALQIRLDRANTTSSFLDMFSRQIAALSSIDEAAKVLDDATGSSVNLGQRGMANAISGMFTLAFLEEVGKRAGLSKRIIRMAQRRYSEKHWGAPRGSAPSNVQVFQGHSSQQGRVAASKRAPRDDGDGEENPRKAKVGTLMGRSFNPFGAM